jgi:hypothetical protein
LPNAYMGLSSTKSMSSGGDLHPRQKKVNKIKSQDAKREKEVAGKNKYLLPTWYQVSEDDHVIPPDAERMFAQRMNATTLSINSSHVAPVSHPDEIAQFILNATKGSTG